MGFTGIAILVLLFSWLPSQALPHENVCGTVQDQSGASSPTLQ